MLSSKFALFMLPQHVYPDLELLVRHFITLRISVLSLIVVSLIAVVSSIAADPNKVDIRTLKFPSEQSLGAVDLMELKAKHTKLKQQVASAKGTLTITVPPGNLIQYYPNQYALMHPGLFDQISPAGIDAVKLNLMSMDKNEDGLCDRALVHLNHFKYASRLDISNSDASDAGLMNLGEMPKLTCILAKSSGVRGKALNILKRFPFLNNLDFSSCCPFQQSALKHLASLPHLRELYLGQTCLANEGVANLTGCTSLEVLNLNQNTKVDDQAMPFLLPLKKLNWLSLENTSVSIKGLRILSQLKIRRLILSRKMFSDFDVDEINRLFPDHVVKFGFDKQLKKNADQLVDPFLKRR